MFFFMIAHQRTNVPPRAEELQNGIRCRSPVKYIAQSDDLIICTKRRPVQKSAQFFKAPVDIADNQYSF